MAGIGFFYFLFFSIKWESGLDALAFQTDAGAHRGDRVGFSNFESGQGPAASSSTCRADRRDGELDRPQPCCAKMLKPCWW